MSEKTQLPRRLLTAHFSDGKWRSVDDMAHALRARIPDEIAARATRKKDGTTSDRVRAGRRRLVVNTLGHMVSVGQAERKKEDGLSFYRIVRPPTLRKTDDRLSPEEFRKPAATLTGLSQAHVYQAVQDHPWVTEEKLVQILAPCTNVPECVRSYSADLSRRRDVTEKLAAAAATPEAAAAFEKESVLWGIHNVIKHLMQSRRLTRRITYLAH